MKKIWVYCFILALLTGCSYGMETIIDAPGVVLKDPHYAGHVKKMENLERRYLQKEINYAEYLEEKKRLEETYIREVREREDEMESFR